MESSLANSDNYTLLPFDGHIHGGVSVLPNPKAEWQSFALQQASNRMGAAESTDRPGQPPKQRLTPEQQIKNNQAQFELDFQDGRYGTIKKFRDALSDLGDLGHGRDIVWEIMMDSVVSQLRNSGKEIPELKLNFLDVQKWWADKSGKHPEYATMLNNYRKLLKNPDITKIDKANKSNALFNQIVRAMLKIREQIQEYIQLYMKQQVGNDQLGGGNKRTTRKYKNRKLSYKRNNKKRTTKNRRRYSRRK